MGRTLVGGRPRGGVAVPRRLGLEALEALAEAVRLAGEVEHGAVLLLDVPLEMGELFLEPAQAVVHLRA
jgi:hypothetical protein